MSDIFDDIREEIAAATKRHHQQVYNNPLSEIFREAYIAHEGVITEVVQTLHKALYTSLPDHTLRVPTMDAMDVSQEFYPSRFWCIYRTVEEGNAEFLRPRKIDVILEVAFWIDYSHRPPQPSFGGLQCSLKGYAQQPKTGEFLTGIFTVRSIICETEKTKLVAALKNLYRSSGLTI